MSSYAYASSLSRVADGAVVDLATAEAVTPRGRTAYPHFFAGQVSRPDIVAAGLMAVADVAATHYADVGLGARLASLDPVVTASGDRLRFEAFSGCNGVYARFDLLREGLSAAEVAWGTTNVDLNQPLRTALSRVGRRGSLNLIVGRDSVSAEVDGDHHEERKVSLPDRWVRGFAEVPGLCAAMTPELDIAGGGVTGLLSSLPKVNPPGPDLHLESTPRGVRAVLSGSKRSLPVAGAARLRGLERLARHATRVTVHRHRHGATAWVVYVPGGRLTLALTQGPYRGFSGEGGLLELLAHPRSAELGTWLQAELGWSPVVDPSHLAAATGLSAADVERGLAWLSAHGRLGYDVAESAWFHRELPTDVDRVLRRNPRLARAERLLASGAVTPPRGAAASWAVQGRAEVYHVDAGAAVGCTCQWVREHGESRGPCAHVLAVRLSQQSAWRDAPDDA